MSKIPDISHYHPVSDWAKVKANCSFLISKATQGISYIDPTLDSFIKGCEANKIPYYLYVYLNKGDELLQAKYMVSVCKSKVGSYFRGYALDVEAGNSATNVKNALDYICNQSPKALLYTMYSQYDKYKAVITSRPSNCAWWEARYGANNGSYSATYPCHTGVDLHQYTSKGTCSGVSGSSVDLNRVSGAKPLSWFTDGVKTATASTTTKTTVSYYSKYSGKSVRIDTIFKAIGVPAKYRGTYKKRLPVAKKNGISNYTGTAAQNKKLIDLAKKGKLVKA